MKFIVRIGVNRNFAAELWNGRQISAGRKIADLLGKYCTAVHYVNLAFAVVSVKDTDSDAVSAHIMQAWEREFPEHGADINIMLIEDTGDAISEVMTVIYGVYYGFEEYQKICTQIARTFPLIRNTKKLGSFYSMSYLVSIDDGCGFTQMCASFSDFLQKCAIYENMDTSYYEYKVTGEDEVYYKWETVVTNLSNEELNFHVVGIDLSYFLDESKRDELRKFIHALHNETSKYVFLFRVPYLDEKAFKEFSNIINDCMPVKSFVIKPYGETEMIEFAYNHMASMDVTMENDVLPVMVQLVAKERRDGRIHGFKTVKKVCDEMLWAKLQSDAALMLKGEKIDSGKMRLCDLGMLNVQDEKTSNGFEELAKLVGMEEVSKRIGEIIAQAQLAKNNDKMDNPCLHMRFVGPPGTGKTTVARIVGKILKEKGILSKGGFFEYTSRCLIGEFIGQTAPKTHQICQEAYGSVLFIDEAYALYDGSSEKDYGKEALTTLIAEMENHRQDLVVIMAGYTDEMAKLMEGNAGLRSRMPFVIEFKSYTREQLADIFMSMAKKAFRTEEGFEETVREYFSSLSDGYLSSKEFSNARFVRNLYERTWAKAALRMESESNSDIVLRKSDFELASQEKEFSEKLMTEKKIGF